MTPAQAPAPDAAAAYPEPPAPVSWVLDLWGRRVLVPAGELAALVAHAARWNADVRARWAKGGEARAVAAGREWARHRHGTGKRKG